MQPETRMLSAALACALSVACASTQPAPESAAPPAGRWADPGALQLSGCLQLGGPALTAGPFVTDLSPTSATVVLQTAGTTTPTVYLQATEGNCTADEVFASGSQRVEARLVEVADVPFAESGDLVPENLYAASFRLDFATSDRRVCYGLELPPPSYDPKAVNRYFCPPDLAAGDPGTSFVVPGRQGERFSFYVYGDTRDPSGFNGIHQAVVDLMVEDLERDLRRGAPPAGFVINTGDYAYSGCQLEDWLNNFFAPARTLLQQLPVFTAPGNHESYSTEGGPSCPRASFYFSFFGSLYDPAVSSAPGVYSFDYKNVRFISLSLIGDSDKGNELFHDAKLGDLDPANCGAADACGTAGLCGYRWLECQLEDAASNTAIDHVFVYYHAPLITAPPAGKHASSEFQIATLAPLFERSGKVAAVIAGHNHFYERSLPLADLCLQSDTGCNASGSLQCSPGSLPGFQFPDVCYDVDPARGVTYVISGGGGAAPYTAPPGPFPDQWLAIAASEYEYLRITVDGGRATLETVGFDGAGKPFRDRAALR